MEALEVRNLSFKYAGAETHALSDVSFSVKCGEFVAVCGATGSGKSTLLRMLKRELVPEGERYGEVIVGGVPQEELSARDAARKIGFVFQDPERQIVCDKVWHELAFGLENLGTPRDVMRRRVAETACYFGIENIFDKKTSELSGGQKQLVALASVSAMRPDIILLDEPTSRLDPIARVEFISTLSRLCRETGITVVAVEHSLGEILGVCDRLMALEEGRVIAFDAPRRAIDEIHGRRTLYLTLPCAPRAYLETGAEGKCPLSLIEGREYIWKNFKNETRSLSRESRRLSQTAALEVKNVFFRYNKTERDALAGASFSVFEGEVFALLGGNGSGKTTALSVVAGLLRPYSGEVRLFGKKLSDYKNQTLYRNCVSMLPQDVQTVFCKNTVYADLADVGGCEFELPYDITHLYNSHPYDLSGGEQQLAALGKVLLTRPRLLLLDEPTKGLDGEAKAKIAEVINTLRDDGVTVVLVTHDADFAAEVASRCAMLFRGEIMSAGECGEFFENNEYYTTEASRMTRGYYDGAITLGDIVELCEKNGRRE